MQKLLFFILIILVLGGSALYLFSREDEEKIRENKETQSLQWERRADMPTPRSKAAVAVFENKIYVIGGLDSLGRTSTAVEVYDPTTDIWDSAPDIPVGCYLCSAVTVRDRLYVIGGFVGLDFQTKADVFEFDPKMQEWTRKASLPTPRAAFGVGAWNENIFVVGGVVPDRLAKEGSTVVLESGPFTFSTGLAVTGEILSYDPLVDQWEVKASAPTKRHSLAVGVIRGLVYVAGGREQIFAKNFNTLEIYDPKTNTWSQGPSMITGLGTVGGTVVNNLFVVAGGEEGESRVFDEVEAFDPKQKKWISLPKLSVARHGLAIVAIENKIYAIGGSTEAQLSTISSVSGINEVFDMK